jgi:hypothetical protein
MQNDKIERLKATQQRILTEAARPIQKEDELLLMLRLDETDENYSVFLAGNPPQLLHATIAIAKKIIADAPEHLQSAITQTVVNHLNAPKENNR